MFTARSRICLSTIFHSPNEFCQKRAKLVNSYFVNILPNRTQYYLKHSYAKSPVQEPQSELKGADTEFPYKIIDSHSPRLTSLMTKAKSRRLRYQNKTIMLEGRRLIIDGLVAGLKPIMILFTRKSLIKDLPLLDRYLTPERTVLHKIPYNQLQNWSDLTTSPGITGIFEMPSLENRVLPFPTLPITLVCDNIREPGNLGSILRIAAAIPVRKVILLSGCVDLWDTKVIRSSCGAMFNLQIENNASWDDVRDTCSGNVIIADHLCGKEENESVISAEDYTDDVDMEEKEDEDEDEEDDEIMDPIQMRKTSSVPILPYHKITYKNRDSFVIVVGGETEGLSEQSFLYAQENKGVRVNIPIAPVVNSLNAATALGIITFEIKRQLEIE